MTPWSEKHLRLANKAAGVAMWSWNVDTDELNLDEDAYALWGLAEGGAVRFEDLSAHIHPSDRDRVRAAFAATRAILGPYEIDFRIMVKDEVRWISARGVNGGDKPGHGGGVKPSQRAQGGELALPVSGSSLSGPAAAACRAVRARRCWDWEAFRR